MNWNNSARLFQFQTEKFKLSTMKNQITKAGGRTCPPPPSYPDSERQSSLLSTRPWGHRGPPFPEVACTGGLVDKTDYCRVEKWYMWVSSPPPPRIGNSLVFDSGDFDLASKFNSRKKKLTPANTVFSLFNVGVTSINIFGFFRLWYNVECWTGSRAKLKDPSGVMSSSNDSEFRSIWTSENWIFSGASGLG